MTQLTQQSVFDKVALGLLKQNKKCGVAGSDTAFECVYDDDCGNRCAIGHMLSDEDIATIKRWRENTSPLMKMLIIFGENESPAITFIRANLGFCRDLQIVHDCANADSEVCANLDRWKYRLTAFASANSLNDQVVKDFQP